MQTNPSSRALFSSLALVLWLSPAAAAPAPPCPGGRFALQGPVLPADAPGVTPRSVEVSDEVAPTVQLEGCGAVAGTRRARAAGTVVRARVDTCGTPSPFRVRLVILPTCDALVGTTRAGGQVAARFVGTLGAPDDADAAQPDPVDTGGATPSGPPVPGTPPTLPTAGPPRITGFSPASSRVGDVVSILGEHFDRDFVGVPYTGRPPYRAFFKSVRGRFAIEGADVTFVSTTELRVTLPAQATSGVVQLSQAQVPGGPGTIFATAGVPFTVLDAAGTPLAALPTLLVRNDSQYDLVSLLVNGQEIITGPGRITRAGDAIAVPLTAAGEFQVTAAIGLSAADRLSTIETTAVVGDGVTVVPIAAMTIEQLLTGSQPSRLWSTDASNQTSIRFFADGTWQLNDNGQTESGTFVLVDWQINARHVVFELQPSLERIALSYDPQNPAFPTAFDTFLFRNRVFVAR